MRKVIICILLLCSLVSRSQQIDDDAFNANFRKLYNQEILEYNSNNNVELSFISSYYYFWKSLVKSNSNLFDTVEFLYSENIKKSMDKDLYALFNTLQLRIQLSKRDYISAWIYANKLKDFYNDSKLDENNEPSLLLWGIYNYFAANARESFIYRSILITWPDASKSLGLEFLHKLCNSHSVFISTEANYILGKIYLEVENNYEKANKHFTYLTIKYPDNKVYKELSVLSKQMPKLSSFSN